MRENGNKKLRQGVGGGGRTLTKRVQKMEHIRFGGIKHHPPLIDRIKMLSQSMNTPTKRLEYIEELVGKLEASTSQESWGTNLRNLYEALAKLIRQHGMERNSPNHALMEQVEDLEDLIGIMRVRAHTSQQTGRERLKNLETRILPVQYEPRRTIGGWPRIAILPRIQVLELHANNLLECVKAVEDDCGKVWVEIPQVLLTERVEQLEWDKYGEILNDSPLVTRIARLAQRRNYSSVQAACIWEEDVINRY